MGTFEKAEQLVKNDIKIKTNTAISLISDLLKVKQNIVDYVMPVLMQKTVPLSIRWKMAEDLNLVDGPLDYFLFSEEDKIDDSEIKEEVLNNAIAAYECKRDNQQAK